MNKLYIIINIDERLIMNLMKLYAGFILVGGIVWKEKLIFIGF